MKVFIDVGHGGNETGAVNQTALEKNLNLAVAKELAIKLGAVPGMTVIMSRQDDKEISIADRCNMANSSKADIVISIHHNANDGKTKGHEVIYSIVGGKGKELAGLISKEFTAIGQPPDGMGIYFRESETNKGKDYYGIIRGCNSPTVITEFGYMDSMDFQKFDEWKEQEKEAGAIYWAVLKYFGILDPMTQPIPVPHLSKEILQFMTDNKISSSPDYWEENAREGKTCNGFYVKSIIENFYKFIQK